MGSGCISFFSCSDQQYSLAKTWLNQNTLDPDDHDSATPLSIFSSSTSHSIDQAEDSSSTPNLLTSEGDPSGSPAVEPPSFASKGEISPSFFKEAESLVPSQLPAYKGEHLSMPEFINLKTAGLSRSTRY